MAEEERIFTREEMADKLTVCLSTLDSLVKNKKIGFHPIGKRIVFTEDDLRDFLARKKKWTIRDSRKEILRLIPADAKKRNQLLGRPEDAPFFEIMDVCERILKPWCREIDAGDFLESALVENMKTLCGNVEAVAEVAPVDIPNLNPALLHRLAGREIPLWEREITPNLKLAAKFFKVGALKSIEMMAKNHTLNESNVAQRSVRVGSETYILRENEWVAIPTPEPGEESGIFNSRYTARIRVALRTKKPVSEREMREAQAAGKSDAAQAQVDLEVSALSGETK